MLVMEVCFLRQIQTNALVSWRFGFQLQQLIWNIVSQHKVIFERLVVVVQWDSYFKIELILEL